MPAVLTLAIPILLAHQRGREQSNPNIYQVPAHQKLYESKLGKPLQVGKGIVTAVSFSPGGTQAIIEHSRPGRKGPRGHIYVRARGRHRAELQLPGPCRVGWIGETTIICLHGNAEYPAGGDQFVSVYHAKTLKKLWTKKLAARAEMASSKGAESYIFVSRPAGDGPSYKYLLRDPEFDVFPITSKGLRGSIMRVTSPAGAPNNDGFAAFCYKRVRSEQNATGYALDIDSRAKLFRKSVSGYSQSPFRSEIRGTARDRELKPKVLQSVTFARVMSNSGYGNDTSLYAFCVENRKVRCLKFPNMRFVQFFVAEEFAVIGSLPSIEILPIERHRDRAWLPREIERLGPVSEWGFPRD
jgi:hypothetical protein